MGRVKTTSAEEVLEDISSMGKNQLVNFLKSHPLLQNCKKLKPDQRPQVGELVWARNLGSIYWPGFIADLEDRTDLEDDPELEVDNAQVTFVMFLEENFRFSAINWDNVIPLQEMEVQKILVPKYNKLVLRRNWHAPQSYKLALNMMEEFAELEPFQRQKSAERIFKDQAKKKAPALPKPIPPSTSELESEKDPEQEIAAIVTEKRDKRKSGLRVSDRIVTNTIEKLKLEQEEKDKAENEKTEATNEDSNGTSPARPSKPVSKDSRPDVGGEVLKNWIKEKFDAVSKPYTFETSRPFRCRECDQEFATPEEMKLCHGLPHHDRCLIKQDNDTFKCQMCLDQLCFLCRIPSEKDNLVHKCTRCDLRFHHDCLIRQWPQAEVQGSSGPITCPVHYCHTCLGEQKIFHRFRDYTASASKSYKCLLCLSTYHKTCLPAGCGEDIMGKEYIICPRHKLTNLKVQQRRIGCLACYKPLKHKDPRRVECSLCVQSLHPECVGYTEEIAKTVSVEEFGRGYRCYSCSWGLFPVYGQVVWFQQTLSTYWPARILYPTEQKARTGAKRLPGQYSLEYFGSTSFYDNASRAIPLHLTTVEIFKRMNVYQDTPKILRAHEEADFFLQFSEANRERILPHPKPIYKKIEKNVYRTISAHKVREPSDVCSCNEDDKESEFVCLLDSGCPNRDMEMECSDRICNSGTRCTNRMFVDRKNDGDFLQERIFPKKGWGVVAKKEFKPGDFVSEYRGEVISGSEMQWRLDRKEEEDPMYILEISKEFFIDAEYIGNLSRLINHSCQPNCEIRKYLSRGLSVGGVFAKRHIHIGEEVTFDYGCGSQSNAPFRCRCGAKGCLVFVGKDVPEDFQVEEDCELNIDKWEDVCSACGYGGRVICCEYPGCGKVWHFKCCGLNRPPHSENWYCPTHPNAARHNKKRKSNGKKASNLKPGNGKKSETQTKSPPKPDKKAQTTPEAEPKKRVSKSVTSQRTPSPKTISTSESEQASGNTTPMKRKHRSSPNASDTESGASTKKQKTVMASPTPSEPSEATLQSQSEVSSVSSSPHASDRKLRSSNSSTNTSKIKSQQSFSPDIIIGIGVRKFNNLLFFTPPSTPQRANAMRNRRRDSSSSSSISTRSLRNSKVDSDEMKSASSASSSEELDEEPLPRRKSTPESVPNSDVVQLTIPEVTITSANISSKRRAERNSKLSEPFSPLRINSYVSSIDNTLDRLSDGDMPGEKSIRVGMMTRSSTESFIKAQEHDIEIESSASLDSNVEELVTDSRTEIASPGFSPITPKKLAATFSPTKKRKRMIRYNSAGDAAMKGFDLNETENETESLFKASSRPSPRHPRHFSED